MKKNNTIILTIQRWIDMEIDNKKFREIRENAAVGLYSKNNFVWINNNNK